MRRKKKQVKEINKKKKERGTQAPFLGSESERGNPGKGREFEWVEVVGKYETAGAQSSSRTGELSL